MDVFTGLVCRRCAALRGLDAGKIANLELLAHGVPSILDLLHEVVNVFLFLELGRFQRKGVVGFIYTFESLGSGLAEI